jgi:hypothetical protein
MHIFIPTLGRADKQITLHNLRDLAPEHKVWLVIQDHESWLYDWPHKIILDKDIKTITPTREAIRTFCIVNKIDKCVMLDDDLQFYIRKSTEDWHLRDPDVAELNGLFNKIELELDIYAHVGVSGREGNNFVKEYSSNNTRYMRLLAYRVKEWNECTYNTEIMEDFDINLQLLLKGYPSYVFYHYAQGQRQTNAPGGCSTWRTHELHERNAYKLARLYPNFVTTRQKENKSGGEFGHRTEVTIQWKKAFQKGQENVSS